jgi:hypothetical protein
MRENKFPVSEREENLRKVEAFIRTTAEAYRTEGIPVGDDGRLEMSAYADLYPDVAKDVERNQMWEAEWHGNASGETQNNQERRQTEGEQLEMLAQAVFAKNLDSRFVVLRSTRHDDRVGKVDTLIFERGTGNLICAFDEVGDTSGVDYEKKQALVQKHNLDGGASLKYGLGIEKRDGKQMIVPATNDHIPLFYIALPGDHIRKGIAEFRPESDAQSEFETMLFDYFIATLSAQVNGLELYGNRLHPALKEKLAAFKNTLGELNSKSEKGKK